MVTLVVVVCGLGEVVVIVVDVLILLDIVVVVFVEFADGGIMEVKFADCVEFAVVVAEVISSEMLLSGTAPFLPTILLLGGVASELLMPSAKISCGVGSCGLKLWPVSSVVFVIDFIAFSSEFLATLITQLRTTTKLTT